MTRSTPPIQVCRPARSAIPVLVSVPHSGLWIPEEELALYAIDVSRLQRDGDLHVDRLYAQSAALGATVVSTSVSRFVVDLNRFPDDVSALSTRGASARSEAGYYGDRGLIWAVTTHGTPIYHQPLDPQIVAGRVATYWMPYHAALRAESTRLAEEFGFCVLLDAHSMPSRAARMHPDRGNRRADVVPGDLFGSSCAPWLTEAVVSFFTRSGLSVHPNVPYSGGAITRTYGRPDQGVHAIQIELSRALYMNERTFEPSDAFGTIADLCTALVRHIGEVAAWQLEHSG